MSRPVTRAPWPSAAGFLRLRQELGARVALVGHSFGGLVCARGGDRRSCSVQLAGSHGLRPLAALGGDRAALIEAMEPLLDRDRGRRGLRRGADAVPSPRRLRPASSPASPLCCASGSLPGRSAMLAGMGQALRTEPDCVVALCGDPALPTPRRLRRGRRRLVAGRSGRHGRTPRRRGRSDPGAGRPLPAVENPEPTSRRR